jgi:hypothetical protein
LAALSAQFSLEVTIHQATPPATPRLAWSFMILIIKVILITGSTQNQHPIQSLVSISFHTKTETESLSIPKSVNLLNANLHSGTEPTSTILILGTRFDNSDSIGFDFQWAHLREKLVGLPSDSLNLMDFNVTTMWIKRENVVVRAGGGINLLSDNFGTEVDYNLTMSAELFPVKPLVMSFEIDHGELGSTHQTHLLSTVGLNLRQAEFMTGYEFRKIGRTELKGPILGMRIWW